MYYLDSFVPHSEAPRNAPSPTKKANPQIVVARHSDAVVRWVKLKQMYVDLRGASVGKNKKLIPHTTNSDVLQLAAAWSREVGKVKADSASQRSEHKRWQRCMETVKQHADPSKPDAIYPRNEEFWQECTSRLAIYLESRKAVPSKWTLLKESVVETLEEIPGALGDATHATAGAVADAGGAVLNFVKKPVNAALVVLGGAILLPPVIRAFRK